MPILPLSLSLSLSLCEKRNAKMQFCCSIRDLKVVGVKYALCTLLPCDFISWCRLNRMTYRNIHATSLHTQKQSRLQSKREHPHDIAYYNAARTFLDRSSISKAFNFLKGRGIPTSEMIFLSPTRISNVPLRGRVEGSPRTQGYRDGGFV